MAEEAFEVLKKGFGTLKNVTAYYGRAQRNWVNVTYAFKLILNVEPETSALDRYVSGFVAGMPERIREKVQIKMCETHEADGVYTLEKARDAARTLEKVYGLEGVMKNNKRSMQTSGMMMGYGGYIKNEPIGAMATGQMNYGMTNNRRGNQDNEQERQGTQTKRQKGICKYNEQGKCAKGDRCDWEHGGDKRPEAKTQICFKFERDGNCPFGDRCRYVHKKEAEGGATQGATTFPWQSRRDGSVTSRGEEKMSQDRNKGYTQSRGNSGCFRCGGQHFAKECQEKCRHCGLQGGNKCGPSCASWGKASKPLFRLGQGRNPSG